MGSIEFKIWLLLVSLMIMFILIALYRINNSEGCKVVDSINSTKLDTGDLLFVSYDNSLGYLMRTWSKSKWTHVGMVYKSPDNKIFVMETANYPDRKGVLFLPIGEWYRYNKKCEISVMKLRKPDNFDSNLLLKSFENIYDKKLDTFSISWFRLLSKNQYTKDNLQENITCYEMVIHLLQEVNIVKKRYSPSSYFPIDIIENRVEFNSDFGYENLSKFII